jgi:NAD(P)H-quinone oxidoreductase subunit 5
MIGGFTALFGGLVMLTQPAIKTSLAWSTVGQMGFMIMQCGLALFPLALLHIVAALALQGACLPRLGRCGGADRGGTAAGSGRHTAPGARSAGPSSRRSAIYTLMSFAFDASPASTTSRRRPSRSAPSSSSVWPTSSRRAWPIAPPRR